MAAWQSVESMAPWWKWSHASLLLSSRSLMEHCDMVFMLLMCNFSYNWHTHTQSHTFTIHHWCKTMIRLICRGTSWHEQPITHWCLSCGLPHTGRYVHKHTTSTWNQRAVMWTGGQEDNKLFREIGIGLMKGCSVVLHVIRKAWSRFDVSNQTYF